MKKFVWLLLLVALPAMAQLGQAPPLRALSCWYSTGGYWVPVATGINGTALGQQPPLIGIVGVNSGSYYPIACDANGNISAGAILGVPFCTGYSPTNGQLVTYTTGGTPNPCYGGSSGPLQTCDASTVPQLANAVCVFTLTTADLLQFDGTTSTAISIIGTPGAGKAIVSPSATANYIAGSQPFSDNAFFVSLPVSNDTLYWGVEAGTSLSTNQFGVSLPLSLGSGSAESSAFINAPLSVFNQYTINQGALATFTIASGGQTDGVNTSQITSGNAGLTYNVGDTPALACGATFYVDSVDSVTGAVLTYHETGLGTGCTTGTGQATTGGGDGTLELDVLTIGAGYRNGDTWQDSYCNVTGNPVDGHVVTTNANGIVTAIAIDTPGLCGTNFLAANPDNLNTQPPGGGKGLSINITSITQGNGSVVLTVPYTVISLQ